MSPQYACYTENDTREDLATLVHAMKSTLVSLVERRIAAAAAEHMRLGVRLTDMGRQKGDDTG